MSESRPLSGRRHGPDRDDQAEEGFDSRDAAGGPAGRLGDRLLPAAGSRWSATAGRAAHGAACSRSATTPTNGSSSAAPGAAASSTLDVLLMRKDPPFDMEYIYTTYILELAEQRGLLVVNKPASLRDINEKAYTSWFPQCTPPSLVTRSRVRAARVPRRARQDRAEAVRRHGRPLDLRRDALAI